MVRRPMRSKNLMLIIGPKASMKKGLSSFSTSSLRQRSGSALRVSSMAAPSHSRYSDLQVNRSQRRIYIPGHTVSFANSKCSIRPLTHVQQRKPCGLQRLEQRSVSVRPIFLGN